MRYLMSTLFVVALCLAVASCTPGLGESTTSTQIPPHTGGLLRVGQAAADIGTADPHYASGTQDRALVDMVYNGLLRYKPGDATLFEPDLATGLPQPTTAGDGRQTWTFNLRRRVMCHPTDGVAAYELTSDDVLYSLRKAASKDTSAYASDYEGMHFTASDPYTVSVTLDAPMSAALFFPRFANYAGGYIVCKQGAEKLGLAALKTHPVGTGPFLFKSYSPKEKIDLVANDAYFRGRPQLDGIEYRYMADLSSRELGLRSGQLDLIFGLQDGKWVDQMTSAQNVRVDVFGVGEVVSVYFNLSKPPFDQLAVRQAVISALDRDEFVQLYGSNVAQKVASPVPTAFMTGGLTEQDAGALNLQMAFDLAASQRLLQQAGLANGLTFSVVSSQLEQYRLIYESMQAQLARAGVTMNLNVVDHATMHDQIRKDVNPLVVYVAFRPTADAYLTQFFHSDSIVVTGKNPNTNFSHYQAVDAEIEDARSEPNAARQEALWKDAQIRILRDAAAYPIMYAHQVYARSSRLEYGHDLRSQVQLYPGIDEKTHFER
jgi:peptide/nickel transport system substrate-binding protein